MFTNKDGHSCGFGSNGEVNGPALDDDGFVVIEPRGMEGNIERDMQYRMVNEENENEIKNKGR